MVSVKRWQSYRNLQDLGPFSAFFLNINFDSFCFCFLHENIFSETSLCWSSHSVQACTARGWEADTVIILNIGTDRPLKSV